MASGDFEQDSRLDVSGLNLNAALDIGGMQPTLGGVAKGLMPRNRLLWRIQHGRQDHGLSVDDWVGKSIPANSSRIFAWPLRWETFLKGLDCVSHAAYGRPARSMATEGMRSRPSMSERSCSKELEKRLSDATCFVISKFSGTADVDPVYVAIRQALEQVGLKCLHLDHDRTPKDIPATIIRAIIESDVIVADISEPSPNVFYELGISHSVGNKTIIITSDLSSTPFDLKSQFTLEYEKSRNGLELLGFRLQQIIPQVLAHPDEPSNLVQIAGRDFFDLRKRIRETLNGLVVEMDRMQAFQAYLDRGRNTDNSSTVNRLAEWVLSQRSTRGPATLVAISGAAALGKTRLASELKTRIIEIEEGIEVGILPTDAFMLDREERLSRNLSGYDSTANRLDHLGECIRQASQGRPISYRPYDHQTGKHSVEAVRIERADVLIIEGIHSFYPATINRIGKKIFLYAPPEDAKELRFITDLFERNYSAHLAFQRAESEYREFENHVMHYIRFADRVVELKSYWEYDVKKCWKYGMLE